MASRKRSSQGIEPGQLGSFEASNRPYYPNLEPETKGQRANITGPSLSFSTDKEAMWTFRVMMRIMEKRKFSNAVEYDGPHLGLSDSTREEVPVEAVLEALQEHADADPPFGGFRMVLVHDRDDGILATLKVKKGTKVKLKVKGTLANTEWEKIRSDVRRKFRVEV